MSKPERNLFTVDAIFERYGKVLLIERGKEPFKGEYALPGGFVDHGERVEDAVVREVAEELNIRGHPKEILGVYSGEDRDPRGPVITTVFVCDFEGSPVAGDDAAGYKWIDLHRLDEFGLAFDHRKILRHFLQWTAKDGTYWSTRD